MTVPGPASATRTPARLGPATTAADRAALSNALALTRSSGGASSTVSPLSAGVKTASPVPRAIASRMNTHNAGCPASTAPASAACAAQRAASAPSMTGRRPIRSARTPPPSMNSTCGTIPAARTTPRSLAVPPPSSTAKDTASADIEVPRSEVAYPAKKRAKSRSRSTRARRRGRAGPPRRRCCGPAPGPGPLRSLHGIYRDN